MKYLASIPLIASLFVAAPALAQYSYYPSYSSNSYSNTAYSCISLTAYQSLGSTDAGTGGQVTMLQQFLNRTGNLSGVSGYFDNGTFGAVINYQNSHGIQGTGTVGPQTRAAINAQSCGSNVGTNYNVFPYNNYGNSYGNGYGYNYYSAPSITSLSVTQGSAGTSVTIYGSFSGTDSIVHFGSQTVQAVLNSNSSLTFTVPSYSTGTYSVYVANTSGSSNSITFSVTSYGNCSNSYNSYNSYSYQYQNNCNCNTQYPYVYNSYNSYNYNNNDNCSNNGNNNGSSYAQPTVSSISGQTSVSAGSTYSWSVTARSQTGNGLNVSVDWGDGTTYQNSQYGTNNQQYSFSHQYVTSGTYTMRITATDSSTGAFGYATLPVYVSGNSYNNGYPYNNNNYNQPYISSLSTTYGRAGNTLTIYGSNFSGNSTVYFGNSAYTPSAMTDSTIIVQIPYLSGSYPVQVRNGSGYSSNSVNLSVY